MVKNVLAAALLFAACFAPGALAQITQIRGTGCPSAPFPRATRAVLGLQFDVSCPACPNPTDASFVILGTTGPSLTLFPPIACDRGGCVLGCTPISVRFPASGLSLTIPRDPTLAGVCVCIQCGCLNRGVPCLTLSGAIQACIERI
jgi:hypothetical protein